MDQIEEKKWFVFMGDRHEGPFSVSEIRPKLELRQIGSSHFVWAEGMADWAPISEVEAFSRLKIKDEEKSDEIALQPEPPTNPALVFDEPKLDAGALPQLQDLNTAEPEMTRTSGIEVPPEVLAAKNVKKLPILTLSLIIIGLGCLAGVGKLVLDRSDGWLEKIRPALNDQIISLIENHPSIASLVSPLPHLSGVSSEDFELLKAAAATSLATGGPSVAVGISKENMNSPVLYLASNLPDGARFDIYIEGVPETLVSQLSVSLKIGVVLDHRLAVSKPVLLDGKPLIRGEYRVYAVESETQPESVKAILSKMQPLNAEKTDKLPTGIKLLARKGYFLGGLKDAAYNQKLHEYHEGLKQKARLEIEELKQFVTQLEGQMNTTVAQFSMFRKTKVAAKKKNWFAFADFWKNQQAPLNDTINKWSSDTSKADYVYSQLYVTAQQAGQAVQKLHDLQKDYFDKKLDERAVDIQVGESQSVAQGIIFGLKTKMDEIEKATPPVNGLPAGI